MNQTFESPSLSKWSDSDVGSKFLRSLTLLPFGLVVSTAASQRGSHDQHTINADVTAKSKIRDILVDNEIIGDVLDDFQPSYAVDVAYPKYHEGVALGNDIPVKAVSERPTVFFHPVSSEMAKDNNHTFTLVLTDPDALSRNDPSQSEMCHWILTNLISPALLDGPLRHSLWTIKKSHELKGYKPPEPPEGTGRHRYVFVLLMGESGTTPKPPTHRPHWGYGEVRHGVQDWAEDNQLKVVGANFFFAQNKKQ